MVTTSPDRGVGPAATAATWAASQKDRTGKGRGFVPRLSVFAVEWSGFGSSFGLAANQKQLTNLEEVIVWIVCWSTILDAHRMYLSHAPLLFAFAKLSQLRGLGLVPGVRRPPRRRVGCSGTGVDLGRTGWKERATTRRGAWAMSLFHSLKILQTEWDRIL